MFKMHAKYCKGSARIAAKTAAERLKFGNSNKIVYDQSDDTDENDGSNA